MSETSGAAARWPLEGGQAVAGTVVTFDAERGVGTIADVAGRELFFHCATIADGTREIEVGQPVTFLVRPGHRGLLEARKVAKR